MFLDFMSAIGWLGWIAIMLFGIFVVGSETYKRYPVRRIENEPSAVRFLRVLFQIGSMPEESLKCQTLCAASQSRVMDSIKDLLAFRRPYLQYPLNNYWWQLTQFDYREGKLAALLKYPETEQSLQMNAVEMVWSCSRINETQIEVSLDWYRLYPWQTRYKHNIMLSMLAYTDEHLRKLLATLEEEATLLAVLPAQESIKTASDKPALWYGNQVLDAGRTYWPTAQDYNEAVQNPSTSFADEELLRGAPELNEFGIPRALSGAFASVYRICCAEKDWALRCFLNPVKDQQTRYALLAKHLLSNPANSIVPFTYLDSGIKVNGRPFPVVKMEWVEGPSLSVYLQENLSDSESLGRLRHKFRQLVLGLRRAKIAHGDLQHGNIIVRNNELVLVDYDGMFAPELFRLHSAELGHPNYQHPRRAGKHFGLFLDNFAGWLIDISLLCIETDPQLWTKFNGGDECILFRQQDLKNPERSELFSLLRSHDSKSIRNAGSFLLELLNLELEEIPFLDTESLC